MNDTVLKGHVPSESHTAESLQSDPQGPLTAANCEPEMLAKQKGETMD